MKKSLQILFIVILIAGVVSLVYICKTLANSESSDESDVVTMDEIESDETISDNEVISPEMLHDDESYYENGPGDFDINNVSDDIILGIRSVPSSGNQYERCGTTLNITASGEAVCYIAGAEVGRKKLDKDAFDEFVAQIDYNEIATMEIYHPDPFYIMDGGDAYVIVYMKNEPSLIRGGFCVSGEEFSKYYKLVYELADYHWWMGCCDDYIEMVQNISENKEEILREAIPDLVDLSAVLRDLETLKCNKIVSISEPIIYDDVYCWTVITDDYGIEYALYLSLDEGNKVICSEGVGFAGEESYEPISEPITYDKIKQMYED